MVSNGRNIALKILIDVNTKGAYSNLAINKYLNSQITMQDEKFIRKLVYGVLENRLYIDCVISRFSKIKLIKISPVILEILRMGVYQIIFMESIPDRAAINEGVNLAKKYSHKGTYGYVNGVLRNISRNKNTLLDIDKKDKAQYISIKYSHPKWLVDRWIREYGEEFTEKLCAVNNTSPKLNIRVNSLKIDKDKLKDILVNKGYKVKETIYARNGLIIENPIKITELDEFKKGLFTIQDESSMLVGQIMDPEENSFVLDLCSAPGGKATHIAQIMNNKGKIVCGDIYEHKLKLIENNKKRLDISIIETTKMDATILNKKYISKFDYCLVDAPCSGLGLIRRRPEIRWNRKLEDIKFLKELQYKILSNASKYVKCKGEIVYSTCTIEKEENIELINKFLKNNKNFKLVDFSKKICRLEGIPTCNKGFIQLFPHIHDTDGFFIAKFRKNSL